MEGYSVTLLEVIKFTDFEYFLIFGRISDFALVVILLPQFK